MHVGQHDIIGDGIRDKEISSRMSNVFNLFECYLLVLIHSYYYKLSRLSGGPG